MEITMDYKVLFENAVRALGEIDYALGIGDDGCNDLEGTLFRIAELKGEAEAQAEGRDEMPLLCKAVGGKIEMGIGMQALCFAAEQHPDLWDGESPYSVPVVKITDVQTFAVEVAREINRESENGSTLLTRMLDAAIAKAVEGGCEGVDHDA